MLRKRLRIARAWYGLSYPTTIVYMLQSTEYQAKSYLAWWWRTRDFSQVMKRRNLDTTRAARLLVLALRLGIGLQYLVGVACLVAFIAADFRIGLGLGVFLIALAPVIWAHLIVLPLELGRLLIVRPRQRALVAESRKIFAAHQGIKLAIVGSYGKTSMKELLATILGERLDVAVTPGNKNVAVSHAYFAKRLTGKEDVVIIEFGEGQPGDVAAFARNIQPTHAVITGIAPAHLDHYKTLDDAAKDIFSVDQFVQKGNVFVNATAARIQPYLTDKQVTFSAEKALGYTVSEATVGLDGTSFTLSKDSLKLRLTSQLVGRHQIATLAFAAAFALQLGMSPEEVSAGIAKTKPYQHRMQPYPLGWSWIIDDTYNGNIEGARAGTELLAELPAAGRKIYVTPGLVDQGIETKPVHIEMGQLIAAAKPDLVVLMQNSVTQYIQQGLQQAEFAGEVRIEDEPLAFYQNLEHIVAAGDIVLMQNDWTDNYA